MTYESWMEVLRDECDAACTCQHMGKCTVCQLQLRVLREIARQALAGCCCPEVEP